MSSRILEQSQANKYDEPDSRCRKQHSLDDNLIRFRVERDKEYKEIMFNPIIMKGNKFDGIKAKY